VGQALSLRQVFFEVELHVTSPRTLPTPKASAFRPTIHGVRSADKSS
jgi:hypothetical protein